MIPTILLALSFVISIAMGLLMVAAFWRKQESLRSSGFLQLFLGIGLGLGISSAAFFIQLVVFTNGQAYGFAVIDGLLLVILSGAAYKRGQLLPSSIPHGDKRSSEPLLWLDYLLGSGLFVLAVADIAIVATRVVLRPYGEWDAWALWNTRARFIYRAGNLWTDTFVDSVTLGHPDYPLLLPGAAVRGWRYHGSETISVPIAIALLFTIAVAGLLVAAVSVQRSKSQGFLAGIILLTSTLFIDSSTWQYADIPLSFFILATLVLLSLQAASSERDDTLSVLVGLSTGLAAWTKNEGLLFAVVISMLFLAFALRSWNRQVRKRLLYFGAGLLPMLAIIVYFKLRLAPPNDLLSAQEYSLTMAKLTDPSRYRLTIETFLSEFSRLGSGGAVALLIFLILSRGKLERKHRPFVMHATAILSLMLAGYFFVYITTPLDLLFHLRTSLSRLFLHLWPAAIFIVLLVTPVPEQLLTFKRTAREE